jgi:hypothetical protein
VNTCDVLTSERTEGEKRILLRTIDGEDPMGEIRNRIRPTTTFEERLADKAQKFREMAYQLPEGQDRDILLRRARQLETTLDINKLLRSTEQSR